MSLVYTANSRPHLTLPLPPEKQNVNSKASYYLDPLHRGWQRAYNSPVVRTNTKVTNYPSLPRYTDPSYHVINLMVLHWYITNLFSSLEFGTGPVFSAQQLGNHWWLFWKAASGNSTSGIFNILSFCAWIFLKSCEDLTTFGVGLV